MTEVDLFLILYADTNSLKVATGKSYNEAYKNLMFLLVFNEHDLALLWKNDRIDVLYSPRSRYNVSKMTIGSEICAVMLY